MASWKESMINRLLNLINRNRSAAKISQVLCSNGNSPADNSASTLKLAVHQELSLSDGLFLIYLHPNILVVHHDKYKCTIYGKQ